jgi:hypothetical protein
MSESKALFYLVNEWSEEKADGILLSILSVIIEGKITEELEANEMDVEEWEAFIKIINTHKFASLLREYYNVIHMNVTEDDNVLGMIEQMHKLIELVVNEIEDVDGKAAHEYLLLAVSMMNEFFIYAPI